MDTDNDIVSHEHVHKISTNTGFGTLCFLFCPLLVKTIAIISIVAIGGGGLFCHYCNI